VFNPAPAVPLPVSYYPKMAHLIVNETEAALLTGEDVEVLDVEAAATVLLGRGVKESVIITLGAKGGYFKTRGGEAGWFKPVVEAKDVVDTTGAGDTFVGAFAVAIVEGKGIRAAVEWSGKAAGQKVRKMGAMAGIPWRGEL
jgi:ribokinase